MCAAALTRSNRTDGHALAPGHLQDVEQNVGRVEIGQHQQVRTAVERGVRQQRVAQSRVEGTAIIAAAALLNGLELVGKKIGVVCLACRLPEFFEDESERFQCM